MEKKTNLQDSHSRNAASLLQELNQLYSDIKADRAAICDLLSNASRSQIQFIDAVYCETNTDPEHTGKSTPVLSGTSYNPQEISFSKAGKELWPLEVFGHRSTNSLPRNTGHLCVPTNLRDKTYKALIQANLNKKRFEKLAQHYNQIKIDSVAKYMRRTELLRDSEILGPHDNYELIVRPYYFSDPSKTVSRLKTNWHCAKPSQPVAGTLNELKAKIDFSKDSKAAELAVLESWDRKHPNTRFCMRFYSPPTVATNISYFTVNESDDDIAVKAPSEWAKKIYNSSPIIVLNWDDRSVFNTIMERLPVTMNEGRIELISKVKRGAKKVVRLDNSMNWYAYS
ncbi:hypothetical protein V6259_12965 [Marinomonas sp. TI.3.20]|uniref:hypothetical protein n=1 Tax=Marinomonas sp. TI.3.20 TaxID=3121296 RepID=UPI00311F68C8